jgi:hypothetical protein
MDQRVRLLPRSQPWYENLQNSFAGCSRRAFVYIELGISFVNIPAGAWSGTDVASTHSDGKAWYSVPGPLEAKFPLPDNQTADHAVQTLKVLAKQHAVGAKKPWFVAVGFHKVRMP